MITTFSIICCIASLIGGAVGGFFWFRGFPIAADIALSLLFGFACMIMMLGLFCVGILVFMPSRGRKFEKINDPNDEGMWRYMRDVAHFCVFWLNYRLDIKGVDELDENKTYIFYSNHQGFLDVFMFDCVLKKFKRGSLYKIEHSYSPLYGKICHALGGEPIDRSNDREAMKSIVKIIKKIDNGMSFMIYPEGTRAKRKGIRPFHPGSFKVALKCKEADVVIFAIDGGDRLFAKVPLIPTKVMVRVVKVIPHEELANYTSITLAEEAHDLVAKEIAKYHEEHHIKNRPVINMEAHNAEVETHANG